VPESTSSSRSVKIGADERGGWSSDRPRKSGAPERPADVSVRGRVLKPSDRLRYSPGSLVVVVSGSKRAREQLVERVVEEKGAILSTDKVRALIAGRVPEDQLDAKAAELLDAAVNKRLQAGASVVVIADTSDAAERERFVRMAAPVRRPRHLVLLEAPRDQVAEEDRQALNELRKAVDDNELGAEGFHTALRLGGAAVPELKRIVFRPEQADD
jgi:predicted kinase